MTRRRSVNDSPAEELRARRSVRAEQLHALDSRVAGSPLLQTGAPLGRIDVTCELLAVTHDRIVRRPVELDTAVSQQDGTVAKTLDRRRVVRDEDNRAAALLELEDLAEALALKLLVADREDLVQQQDVGVDVRRDREPEAHVHPRRVRAHGQVDELLEPGEGDDLVQLLAHVRALEAVDRAVEEDVLAAGHVGVEAGAELEQRADAPTDVDTAGRRLDDPGEQAQKRRLAGTVASDETDRAPGVDVEGDVIERPHLRGPRPASGDDDVLQPTRFARIHLEVPRGMLGGDLAGSNHASEGTASTRRTSPASTCTNAGSAFGISILRKPRPSCVGLLRGLVVEIPADLEMVGDEADRADQHVANPAAVQFPQVIEDVRPEPRLAGLGLALERERPCLERCALCD